MRPQVTNLFKYPVMDISQNNNVSCMILPILVFTIHNNILHVYIFIIFLASFLILCQNNYILLCKVQYMAHLGHTTLFSIYTQVYGICTLLYRYIQSHHIGMYSSFIIFQRFITIRYIRDTDLNIAWYSRMTHMLHTSDTLYFIEYNLVIKHGF